MRLDLPSRAARGLVALTVLGLLAPGCPAPEEREVSAKARVLRKPGQVWGRDLARGLGLLPWELCQELGESDCIEQAHRITLGGTEAERLGVDEPLPNALVSAPIAADRVAIAACGERYARDSAGSPVIFGPVLEKGSRKAREDVSVQLVRRLLSREPTKAELDALEDLHRELEPIADDLPRDWAVGACVVVATSTEALFY